MWANGIIERYRLDQLWDLNRREEAEIVLDFCQECPEDVRDVLANLDETLIPILVSDRLEFANRVYELLWLHVEQCLDAALEVYIPYD